MVTKQIPSLYMCVHTCRLLLVNRHLCHTGWRPERCRKHGLGRAEMGGRQGKVPRRERFLFWGWKRHRGSAGMPGNPGRSNSSQSCSLVLSGSLAQPQRDLFSLCMLTSGWILWFFSQVLAGHTGGPSFLSHSQ